MTHTDGEMISVFYAALLQDDSGLSFEEAKAAYETCLSSVQASGLTVSEATNETLSRALVSNATAHLPPYRLATLGSWLDSWFGTAVSN